MELQGLHCKSCGAPINDRGINQRLRMARCEYCGTVFNLSDAPEATSHPQIQHLPERQPVPMPKGIEVVTDLGALQITYRWFSAKYIFMLIFTVFWNGFMLVWHGISLFSGAWMMSAFGLLHTAVGIGIGYYTLAGLLNRTTVWVQGDVLRIDHAPLPWFGVRQIRASAIDQLYCREKVHRSDNGTSYSYQVHAALRDGSQEKLLSNLSDPEQALYIEQELERHLRITDRPVRGELRR